MPFDSAPSRPVSPVITDQLAKIDKVIALLDRPEKWCKGILETPSGQHCIVGALRAVGAEELAPIIATVIGKGGRWANVPRQIESFNDRLGTGHSDVVRVLHRAREIIEREAR